MHVVKLHTAGFSRGAVGQPRPPPTLCAGKTYLTSNLNLYLIMPLTTKTSNSCRRAQLIGRLRRQSPGARNSERRLQMRCSGNLVLHPPMRIYQVPRSSRLVTRKPATNTRGRAYVVRRVAVSSPCFAAAAPTAPSPSLRPLVSS